MDGKDIDLSQASAEIRARVGNNGNWTNQASGATVPGAIGQAINLDGINDFVDIVPGAADITTGTLTLSAWIYATSTAGANGQRIIALPYNESGGVENYTLMVQSNTIALWINSLPTPTNDSVTAAFTTPNSWHHIVGTYNKPVMTIYIDGVQKAQKNHSVGGNLPTHGSGNLQIGRFGPTWGQYFGGAIDDVRIYNRVLSQAEITRLYQQGAGTKQATTLDTNPNLKNGLVGWWTFDGPNMDWGSTTAEVKDKRAQGNNGDATGGLDASSAVPGVIGQALQIPGSSQEIDVAPNASINLNTILSIAFWVRWHAFRALPSWGGFLLKLNATVSGWDVQNIASTKDLYVRVDTSAGADQSACRTQPISNAPDRQWHHVVIILSGTLSGTGTCTGYEDGVLISSGDLFNMGNGFDAPGSNLIIAPTQYTTMDDVRIYNRALSATEITRLYGQGK